MLAEQQPPLRFVLKDHRVRVGSSPYNDLVIPDKAVARQQFHIQRQDGAHVLTDLSGQGTPVNGLRVRNQRLQPGDQIRLGQVTLSYRLDAEPDRADKPGTRRIPPAPRPGKGRLRWQEEAREAAEIPLEGILVIGADPSCHVQLADPYVSSRHCQLTPSPHGVTLTDLGSTNGTWIEEIRVIEALLPRQVTFRLGKTLFRFEGEGPAPEIPGEEDSLGMVGRHPSLLALRALLKRLAPLTEIVLIAGETGTGKELSARALHQMSPRHDQPFICVNCAAISPELVESELFGHEKGAFTGATGRRVGAFEAAAGGTIFLDEIGELPLSLQAKLLRTLDSGEIKPVGSNVTRRHQARVVAATNRDLAEEVRERRFREDLYFRLNVLPLRLPPLRERREDIPLLAEHLLRLAGADVGLSHSALELLTYHYWPGNVRELRNVLTTTLWYHPEIFDTGQITDEHLELAPTPFGAPPTRPPSPLTPPLEATAAAGCYEGQTLQEAEAQLIREALAHFSGNKRMVARSLGISKSALYDKLRRYGIE